MGAISILLIVEAGSMALHLGCCRGISSLLRNRGGNWEMALRLSRRPFYSAILSGDEPEDLSISSHRKFSSTTANATRQSPKEQSGRHSEELPVVGKKQ